jgi:hypothetical protein
MSVEGGGTKGCLLPGTGSASAVGGARGGSFGIARSKGCSGGCSAKGLADLASVRQGVAAIRWDGVLAVEGRRGR